MAKHFFKRGTVSTVIALLLLLIYELTGHLSEKSLPPSDKAIDLYANQTGDNLTSLYTSAIKSAQESITLVIYGLSDPIIIEALRERSEAGTPVYIVSDAKASPGIARQLPKATLIKRVGKGLMHQKILIIDRKKILLGSANMTPESLNIHGNLVVLLEHPAVAELLTKKALSMDDEGHSTPLPHCCFKADSTDLELWMLPEDRDAPKRIIELIRSAKKTIQVAMFTWTRPDFTEELIAAAKRGVKVEAVIDRNSGKGASAKIVKLLKKGKIPVRLSSGQGLLHHKFLYIDHSILVNGSANWTHSAFNINDDCFLVISPLTESQQIKMNFLWQAIDKQSTLVK